MYTVLPRLKPHGIISETGFGGPKIARFGYYPTGTLSETPSGILPETGIACWSVFIGDSVAYPHVCQLREMETEPFSSVFC